MVVRLHYEAPSGNISLLFSSRNTTKTTPMLHKTTRAIKVSYMHINYI